jgi:hypothetical protein
MKHEMRINTHKHQLLRPASKRDRARGTERGEMEGLESKFGAPPATIRLRKFSSRWAKLCGGEVERVSSIYIVYIQ